MTSGGLGIDELGFKRYLRDIAAGRNNNAMDRAFPMRQQKNLGINSSFLKAVRRVSGDYARSNAGERTALSARMVNINVSTVSFVVILVSSIWVL